MVELKAKMFEEVKADEALRILDSRRLNYSQVRLLPKQASVRPIMNLRRRAFAAKDTKVLGQSINTILGPVYNMLKLEKVGRPCSRPCLTRELTQHPGSPPEPPGLGHVLRGRHIRACGRL